MSAPNWLGLLKWTLATSDGTSASPARPMSDEDKMFLEKIMKECVKDEPARLNEIIQEFIKLLGINIASAAPEGIVLPPNVHPATNTDEVQQVSRQPETISRVIAATDMIEGYLDELDEIVDQIDMAQIFVKFGGFECLLQLLEIIELDNNCRGHIATVMGELSQNNLKVQDHIFNKNNSLKRVIEVYLRAADNDKLRTKVLYAISCSVRTHPAAEVYFVRHYASDVFRTAFQSHSLPLIKKVLYFASALISSDYLNANTNTVANEHHESLLLLPLMESVIPISYQYLAYDDMELREATCLLLKSVLQTQAGWTAIKANATSTAITTPSAATPDDNDKNNNHDIDMLLNVRINSIKTKTAAFLQTATATTDEEREEKEEEESRLKHELSLLLEVQQLLYVESPSTRGTINSNNNTSTAASNSNNSLMIV